MSGLVEGEDPHEGHDHRRLALRRRSLLAAVGEGRSRGMGAWGARFRRGLLSSPAPYADDLFALAGDYEGDDHHDHGGGAHSHPYPIGMVVGMGPGSNRAYALWCG